MSKLVLSFFIAFWLCLLNHVPCSAETPPVLTSSPKTVVATPSAAPEWAQVLIVLIEKIPVVGPILAKILLYLGIVSAVLTGLCSALLSFFNTLMGVFTALGRIEIAGRVAKWRDSRIMYWLRFFSLFNARSAGQTYDFQVRGIN